MDNKLTSILSPKIGFIPSIKMWFGGINATFGTRVNIELSAVDVGSKTVRPNASTGTMTISGVGELSLDKETWSNSISYTAGAKVWARGDASAEYNTSVVYIITGVNFSDTFSILTRVDPATLTNFVDRILFTDESLFTD